MVVNVRVHEAQVSALHNEEDSKDKSTWQMAQVRVDAFKAKTLSGHVRSVDTVASSQDFFASDVKFYKTMVTIDEPMEGLKPGMNAEVTITADQTPDEVLVVPVQAVFGNINMGSHPECFVLGPDGQPELRELEVGLSNQRVVEVRKGLKEGDKIVLNPGASLGEDGDKKPGKNPRPKKTRLPGLRRRQPQERQKR